MKRGLAVALCLALAISATEAHVCHSTDGEGNIIAVSCYDMANSHRHRSGHSHDHDHDHDHAHHHEHSYEHSDHSVGHKERDAVIHFQNLRGHGRGHSKNGDGAAVGTDCTCDDGSSPMPYCLDKDTCYTVDAGSDCNGGGGPTDNVCGDICAVCGSSSDDDKEDDGAAGDDRSSGDDDATYLDDTCAELSAEGKMSGISCSPETCVEVSNPDCDTVTFTQPMNDMETCTDSPDDLIYTLFEAEVNDNARPCSAVTAAHPICSDLPGFFAQINHSFAGAYCNDEYLVLWAHGLYANGTAMCDSYRDHLAAIPRPPGVPYYQGGDSYEDQCVARTSRPQLDVYKIPLSPATMLDSPTEWDAKYYFPSSAVAVMLDGLAHYPALDASGVTVWDACESSLCNAHVGMGMDLHHHGNPGPGDTCFYSEGASPFYTTSSNITDSQTGYTGSNARILRSKTDPHGFPVGFSADGYFMYGQYESVGDMSPSLDACGGHSHSVDNSLDPNTYHYHPYTTKTGSQYEFWMGPSQCWKGDVTEIDNFYEDEATFKLNYDSSKTCSVTSRSDYSQIQACTDSKDYMYYPGKTVQPCNWFTI